MNSSKRDLIFNPCVFCKRNFNVEGHLKTCIAVHWNDSRDVEMDVKLYPPTMGGIQQIELEEQTVVGQHVIYASRLSKAPVSMRKGFAQARRNFPPVERAETIEIRSTPECVSSDEDDLLLPSTVSSSPIIDENWDSDESYSVPLMPSIQPKEIKRLDLLQSSVRRRVNEQEKENKRQKVCKSKPKLHHTLSKTGYTVMSFQSDLFVELQALFKGFRVSRSNSSSERLNIDVEEEDPTRFKRLERILLEFSTQHLGTAYQLVFAHLQVALLDSKADEDGTRDSKSKRLEISAIVALDDSAVDIFTGDEKNRKTVAIPQGSIFLCHGALWRANSACSVPNRQLHVFFKPKSD